MNLNRPNILETFPPPPSKKEEEEKQLTKPILTFPSLYRFHLGDFITKAYHEGDIDPQLCTSKTPLTRPLKALQLSFKVLSQIHDTL